MKDLERIIYHCDCNGFFASVEETFHPEYKEIPMAVAGDPENRRGIILAKNEPAKKFGIQTAETVWQARKKCPGLLLVPPRRKAYREYCEKVNAIYEQYTDRVERFGIDESYLDVTETLHLFGNDASALAHQIRKRVHQETGLTISVGVSWNKILAKLGSDYKKPNAVTCITRTNYKDIVWPLPVSDLFLVGRNTAQKLHGFGITTIGMLAQTDEIFLKKHFGKLGEQLYINANGMDENPVMYTHEHEPVKSVGNGITFKRNLISETDIRTAILALSDTVAERLRHEGIKCHTVQVTVKNVQLKTFSHQKPLAIPTFLSGEIAKSALELIKEFWRIGEPVRMMNITALQLIPAEQAVEQLSFFDDSDQISDIRKKEQLETAMDQIRRKHGKNSIKRGIILDNDLGID